MENLNALLLERIEQFIETLFAPEDRAFSQNIRDAAASGSARHSGLTERGQAAYLIAKICRARRILEIGTLTGYSTTWLARALPAGGSVTTLELEPAHAEVARRNLARRHFGSSRNPSRERRRFVAGVDPQWRPTVRSCLPRRR